MGEVEEVDFKKRRRLQNRKCTINKMVGLDSEEGINFKKGGRLPTFKKGICSKEKVSIIKRKFFVLEILRKC